MINVYVNVKNRSMRVLVKKVTGRILLIVIVNVVKLVILVSTWILKTVHVNSVLPLI